MTTTYRHPPTARHRRLRVFWLLGVALLAVSAIGSGVALRSQGGGSAGTEPAATAGDGIPVVAMGYVDSKEKVRALSPSQPGRVARILVGEGQEVEEGEALLELDDYVVSREVQKAKASYEAAEDQVKLAEQGVSRHPLKIREQEQAIAGAESRFKAAQAERDRAKNLADINQANADMLKAATENANALENLWKVEKIKLEELNTVDPTLELSRACKDAEAKKAQWEQAEYTLKQHRLTAPMKGTVLRILTNPGDVFGPQSQQPALFFCPTGPRIVRAEVEQEFASRVAEGMPATIQDDTTARSHWRGKVIRVGDWYTQRRTVLPEPVQLHDVRTLECIIELDANQPQPRINQRMRVTLGR